jgi:HEAT repeat protein
MVLASLLAAGAAAAQTSGDVSGALPAPLPWTTEEEHAPDDPDGSPDDASGIASDRLERVTLLLSAYHSVPDREALKAADSAPTEVLTAIARDEATFTFHRYRALAALSQWPDASTFSLYAELLESPSSSDGMRHQVMPLLARTFGETALHLVAPYLESPDPQLRLTAVEALNQMGTESAREALLNRRALEPSLVVRERIEAAVAVLR